MKKIKVILKAPGAKPYVANIDPDPENIKRRIGGEFQMFRYDSDCCIICAKRESAFDYNCEFLGRDFRGLMIFCGYSEREILPFPEDFKIFKKIYRSLFEDFEREEKKICRNIGELMGIILCIGLWGWIGFEFIRQICELL